MFQPRRRDILLAMGALPFAASAQPGNRALGLIVSSSPGGSTDAAARRFAQLASEQVALDFAVENISGGSGVIAAREFLRRPADGRTVLMATSGIVLSTPVMTPTGFDPLSDFVPICSLVRTPFVLVAARGFPADNLADLQRLGQKQAAPLSVGVSELGGANHMAAELLFDRLGLHPSIVPYRNLPQAPIDIAEGRLQVGVYSLPVIGALMKADRLKVLAVLSDTPMQAMPQFATVASQGFGRSEMQGWQALFVAKGTPAATAAELERKALQVARSREYTSYIVEAGLEPWVIDAKALRAAMDTEGERYKTLLRKLKLA